MLRTLYVKDVLIQNCLNFPGWAVRIILITMSTKGSDAIFGKKISKCIRNKSHNKR